MTSTPGRDDEPARALEALRDPLADLQEGLERGNVLARAYFGRRDASDSGGGLAAAGPEPEPWGFDITVYNTLLRYHTKRFLLQRHRLVVDEAFDVADASNLGLHLRHEWYRVRVRKSADLTPPVPGDSLTLQAFYRQQSLIPDERAVTNLLVVWTTAPTGIRARLVKPLDGERTVESVATEWSVDIPDLAYERVIRAGAGHPRPASVPLDDLDFRPASSDETERKGEDAT